MVKDSHHHNSHRDMYKNRGKVSDNNGEKGHCPDSFTNVTDTSSSNDSDLSLNI